MLIQSFPLSFGIEPFSQKSSKPLQYLGSFDFINPEEICSSDEESHPLQEWDYVMSTGGEIPLVNPQSPERVIHKLIERYRVPKSSTPVYVERLCYESSMGGLIPYKIRYRLGAYSVSNMSFVNGVCTAHGDMYDNSTDHEWWSIGQYAVPRGTMFETASEAVASDLLALNMRRVSDDLRQYGASSGWDTSFAQDTYTTQSVIADLCEIMVGDFLRIATVRELSFEERRAFFLRHPAIRPACADPFTYHTCDMGVPVLTPELFRDREGRCEEEYLGKPIPITIRDARRTICSPVEWNDVADRLNETPVTDCHVEFIFGDTCGLLLSRIHHVFNRFHPTASRGTLDAYLRDVIEIAKYSLAHLDEPTEGRLVIKKNFNEEAMVELFERGSDNFLNGVHFNLAWLSMFPRGISIQTEGTY